MNNESYCAGSINLQEFLQWPFDIDKYKTYPIILAEFKTVQEASRTYGKANACI
jgi:hypothetical protein